MKELKLRYKTPAERTNEGWEKYSLPIGNGYSGASVFGGYDVERVQFTANAFANTFRLGGVSNFLELFIDFNDKARDYERGLDLRTGIAYSEYLSDFGKTVRKAFFGYPDNVFVYRAEFEKPRDLGVKIVIPYLGERPLDEGGRTGEVFTDDDKFELVARGTLPSRELKYTAKVAVVTDGKKKSENGQIIVINALYADIYVVFDTSYRLCSEAFSTHKAVGDDPTEKVSAWLENALKLGYEKLLERHVADFSSLMNRAELDLGGKDDGRAADELLQSYREGNAEPIGVKAAPVVSVEKRNAARFASRRVDGSRQIAVGERILAQHQYSDELLARFFGKHCRGVRRLRGFFQGVSSRSGEKRKGVDCGNQPRKCRGRLRLDNRHGRVLLRGRGQKPEQSFGPGDGRTYRKNVLRRLRFHSRRGVSEKLRLSGGTRHGEVSEKDFKRLRRQKTVFVFGISRADFVGRMGKRA